jgi:hypothetical protein
MAATTTSKFSLPSKRFPTTKRLVQLPGKF